MRIDEFPNIDELVYEKIVNQVPIIDKYVNQEINRVLGKIRDEIEELWQNEPCAINGGCLDEILEIIDKHKAERHTLQTVPEKSSVEFVLAESEEE